jgi:hypothetical protein
MRSIGQTHKVSLLAAILIALSVILANCQSPSPQSPHLRIVNGGTTPVKNLTVLFPQDEIEFGDIPAGATTEYKEVPNGVFRYAAYRFEMDGRIITQPVIDWVGEEPMEGNAFTYTIEVDFSRPQLQMVLLISVTRDD